MEGMTVFFVLDRSQSVPSPQQEAARAYVNLACQGQEGQRHRPACWFSAPKPPLNPAPTPQVDLRQIQAVVGTERTDIASAIRLGTAAFPETGQKRLVLLSDGNENVGDALSALAAARPLGVSLDVVPLGASRGNDVSIRKLTVPTKLSRKARPST